MHEIQLSGGIQGRTIEHTLVSASRASSGEWFVHTHGTTISFGPSLYLMRLIYTLRQ